MRDEPVRVARFPRPHAPVIPEPSPVPEQPATVRQLRYLKAVAREAGHDLPALDNRTMQEFGVLANNLTRADASTLIDLIQSEHKQFGGV